MLIVDDAVFMRNMIRDIFLSGGFEVIGEAANGLEAVEKYRGIPPYRETRTYVARVIHEFNRRVLAHEAEARRAAAEQARQAMVSSPAGQKMPLE